MGALDAGASFYAGYPITPSSEIMEEWAKLASESKELVFLQTEDEIAAIHAVIGASLTNRKAFTATSGPGFSLMQEGIGLGFSIESPIVIIDSQRQGPSTGMPTMGAQGDLLQTQYGSHGDYKTIAFYPNSVQECYKYTIIAFNAACEATSPVILLMDGLISHIQESVDLKYDGEIKQIKRKPLAGTEDFRYFTGLTSVGTEARTKDPAAYEKWVTSRLEKVDKVSEKYRYFEYYGKKGAKRLIVAFGIISRVIYEIVDQYPDEYALFRPITMFPVLDKELKEYADMSEQIICPEMNKGQYSHVLKEALLRDVKHISVGGGGIVTKSEIENKLKNIK